MTEEQMAVVCKALAHPARIRIVKKLLAEDRCIYGRIADLMPLAQSTISQHLKILKESGLVQGEIEGQRTCYCADREVLQNLAEELSGLVRLVACCKEKCNE